MEVTKKVVWKLKNMSQHEIESSSSKAIDSPVFELVLGGVVSKWCIRVYPKGQKLESRSHISVFLMCRESCSPKSVVKFKFKFFGKTEDDKFGEAAELSRTGEGFKQPSGYGWPTLIEHGKYFSTAKEINFDGQLTVLLQITISSEAEAVQSQSLSNSCIQDYKKIFEDELFSDFQLKTSDGEILKAHKAILAARSQVFYAMLTNDMKEANKNVADIEDFDSKVMKEVLHFIYYNKFDPSIEIASDLVYAAEKYQLEELKQKCLERIVASLSVENVIKALIISHQVSNASKLFFKSLEVFISNCQTISKTYEYKILPKELLWKIINATAGRLADTINI